MFHLCCFCATRCSRDCIVLQSSTQNQNILCSKVSSREYLKKTQLKKARLHIFTMLISFVWYNKLFISFSYIKYYMCPYLWRYSHHCWLDIVRIFFRPAHWDSPGTHLEVQAMTGFLPNRRHPNQSRQRWYFQQPQLLKQFMGSNYWICTLIWMHLFWGCKGPVWWGEWADWMTTSSRFIDKLKQAVCTQRVTRVNCGSDPSYSIQ